MSSRPLIAPFLLAALGLAAGLTACGGDPAVPTPATGRLEVRLVDAPAIYEDLQALTVTFREVQVHRATGDTAETDTGEGWITILDQTLPDTARTFDLLQLVGGVDALLADAVLPVGPYTQLRIVLGTASMTMGGVTYPLTVPSGMRTGIKLVGGFRIDPDQLTSLTLDFDAARSLVESPPGSGDFRLVPAIRMVQTVLSGTIGGTVTPAGIGAVVNAYDAVADTLVTSTYPDAAGAYVLRTLMAGIYDVEAYAAGYDTVRIDGVPVVAGESTAGIDLDLTLLVP